MENTNIPISSTKEYKAQYWKEYISKPENKQRKLERDRKYRRENKERLRDVDRARHVRNKYDLSLSQYDLLVSLECAVCGAKSTEKNPIVCDHSHSSGRVRNALCFSCNTFLGHIEKKGVPRTMMLISYLILHGDYK